MDTPSPSGRKRSQLHFLKFVRLTIGNRSSRCRTCLGGSHLEFSARNGCVVEFDIDCRLDVGYGRKSSKNLTARWILVIHHQFSALPRGLSASEQPMWGRPLQCCLVQQALCNHIKFPYSTPTDPITRPTSRRYGRLYLQVGAILAPWELTRRKTKD